MKREKRRVEYFPADDKILVWRPGTKQYARFDGWIKTWRDTPKTRRECQREAKELGGKAVFIE